MRLRACPGGAAPPTLTGLHFYRSPQPGGGAAAGPVHPQTWFCVCCPAVSGTRSGQLCRATDGRAPAWPQPLFLPSTDTLRPPRSKL